MHVTELESDSDETERTADEERRRQNFGQDNNDYNSHPRNGRRSERDAFPVSDNVDNNSNEADDNRKQRDLAELVDMF